MLMREWPALVPHPAPSAITPTTPQRPPSSAMTVAAMHAGECESQGEPERQDAPLSALDPGCVKTPTSNFRVEILSRLRWIGKELLCQSSPKEEKGENNSAHSLLARVFTQPGSLASILVCSPHAR